MFTPQVRSVPPSRPTLSEGPSQFLLLERAVEDEFRPRMLEELQRRVNVVAETVRATKPVCQDCKRHVVCQDVRSARWLRHVIVAPFAVANRGLYWIG